MIEVMVVIVLIGILSAIAIPSYNGIRAPQPAGGSAHRCCWKPRSSCSASIRRTTATTWRAAVPRSTLPAGSADVRRRAATARYTISLSGRSRPLPTRCRPRRPGSMAGDKCGTLHVQQRRPASDVADATVYGGRLLALSRSPAVEEPGVAEAGLSRSRSI